MKFAYSKFEIGNGKNIYRPLVRILFRNGKNFILTKGIIDSGADYNILPIETASALGITLDLKTKKIFTGAGKNTFNVYPSKIKISYILDQNGFRSIKWDAEVYFAESQRKISLGYHGFVDNFQILFDGLKKEVEVTT